MPEYNIQKPVEPIILDLLVNRSISLYNEQLRQGALYHGQRNITYDAKVKDYISKIISNTLSSSSSSKAIPDYVIFPKTSLYKTFNRSKSTLESITGSP